MVLEEVDTTTNLSSKEANVIVDDPDVSNISHNSIWIFDIVHCPASKVVNAVSTDQNVCTSTVSVKSGSGQNYQSLVTSCITSIGMSPALAIASTISNTLNSPTTANNTMFGQSQASTDKRVDLRNKDPDSFNSHDTSIGINCSALYILHASTPDLNFSASVVS